MPRLYGKGTNDKRDAAGYIDTWGRGIVVHKKGLLLNYRRGPFAI